MHPLLRVDDIYGGVYSPGDGTIDPTSICNAYAKASRRFGGGVYENIGVSGIEVEDYLTAGSAAGRRIKAVLTSCGKRIETPTVVNACGAWANELAAMAGPQLPAGRELGRSLAGLELEGLRRSPHKKIRNSLRGQNMSLCRKSDGQWLSLQKPCCKACVGVLTPATALGRSADSFESNEACHGPDRAHRWYAQRVAQRAGPRPQRAFRSP